MKNDDRVPVIEYLVLIIATLMFVATCASIPEVPAAQMEPQAGYDMNGAVRYQAKAMVEVQPCER